MANSNESIPLTQQILKTIVVFGGIFIYAIYSYLYLIFRIFVSPSMKSLDGEIFLITGSSTGIGRQVVLELARRHPKTTLVLWDWNGEENKKTADDARKLGATVYTYQIDITDRKLVRETAKKVEQEVGDVTILLNNAGIANFRSKGFFKVSEEEIEKVIQVNLISHFWTLRAFLPRMIEKNHGHIVTTASLGSFVGTKICVPYFASKFSIPGYLEALKDEIYSHPSKTDQIRFTTIFPNFVQTPLTSNINLVLDGPNNEFLEAEYVAKRIIEGIRQNQKKVFIPRSAELIVLLKGLVPSSVVTRLVRAFVKYTDSGKN